MKKIWLLILWLTTVLLIWNFTQAKDYEYTNLDITANILIDGTIDVKEDFTANFFVNKHGIIRDIPLNYSVWWNDFHIEVSNINVQWKTFTTSKNNWNIEIKIWDADRTVIWKQSYPISYTTYWLIRNFSWMWYAELYWNLVGYDFDTNINKVRAEIILPKTYTWFTADDFLITTDWTSKTIDWFEWTVNWSKWDKIIITYDKWLSAYHGITLAIKFPNNYFEFNHKKQANLSWISKNTAWEKFSNFMSKFKEFFWIIILFIIAIIGKIKIKTPKINTKIWNLEWKFADQFPVIVQYWPPQWLNSAEVWLLLHREAKAKDMISLIYKRAAEWLINIATEKTEWSIFSSSKNVIIITKNKDIPENLPGYEQDFFNSLIRSEKNKIGSSTNLYNKLHLSSLVKYGKNKWWFLDKKNSNLLLFFWLVWAYFLCCFYPTLWILLLFGMAFLFKYMWWNFKLKETEEWAKLISHILWYRKFLAACDENKLRLFLQQDPLYFDKTLPYAVVFWLETELLKKIEPIMQEMNIKSSRYSWDFNSMHIINNIVSSASNYSVPPSSSYSSSGWFSSGSSFSWWWGWFSSWWGWGWWWWSSW